MMRAEITSITFTSDKCWYCDERWKYELEVQTIDSETKELTGKTVEIYVCEACRGIRFSHMMGRVTTKRVRDLDGG